ncbi:MAG: gliding motility-associated C-terminal domain-containing protein [Nonlabens sp.]|uniref:Ig-like domain-containing protein n=1 Tax=Nonlabens sp. TaxID=1888209 RepID=UPI003EF4C4B6
MKQLLHNSFAKRKMLFIALIVLPFLQLQAQCPSVPVSPQTICDASQLTFNDLNAFTTPGANPVRWFLNPTGGTPIPPGQLVLEGTYYAGDTSGNCGTRPALQVVFNVGPSGQSLDAIFCSNENPTVQSYIDEALTVNIPAGGNVEIYSDFALTMMLNPTSPLTGNANYFIVFEDSAGCRGQIESGSTAVFASPTTPTPPAVQQFCSDTNPTIADLTTGTTDNFNWYDSVDGANNPIPPALQLTVPLVDGETYYIQADNFFCESDVVAVLVEISDPVNPGVGTTIEYCIDNLPAANFDLFPLLTGMPDATGTWTGPTTITGGNTGTTNISALTAGTYNYIYTVMGTDPCPDETATVVIVINEVLTSGTPSALNPLTFCESQAPTAADLFSLLDNEDAGGIWTQGTSSADPVVTSPFDFTGFTPGTYDFTYSQNVNPNPCPEESTTVQVVILADPNAGTAVVTEFCVNDLAANSPYDLFNSLDGSQDNNLGTWTDAANAPVVNPIDITGFTVAGSPYSFTYTIDNGSCMDMETIVITVLPAPESGNYIGTPFEVCEDQAAANSPYDLFNLLDGTQDTNGTWFAGTDTTGTAVTNPIDLTTLGNGTFDFTYSVPAIGTCTDVDVTVQVIINPLPNTGTPTPLLICVNDLVANSPVDLFNQLTGQDAGGTWSDDDMTGALTGSNVDITGFAVGSYNFSYSITDANGCMNSSTVVITIEPAPESGNYVGTPFEVCEDQAAANSPYDLFNLLDGTQDTNGTWFAGTDTTGTAVTNPIDLTTLGNGTFDFTYSVPAIGTCTDVDVTVQVIINPLPNTGTPTPLLICVNDLVANSPVDLFNQLTGQDAGGTWSDDDMTGALTGSNVDITGFAVGSYNFSYSITDANGCMNSSTVVITIEPAPESGNYIGTPFEVCEDQAAANSTYDLFNLLDGTQDTNGTWFAGTDTTGTAVTNPIDLTTLGTGTFDFTYSVPAIGTCTDVDVTVQVIISEIGNPGTVTPYIVCETDLAANSPLDLFGQLTGEDAGGTWTDNDATGALTGSDVDLTLLTPGTYNFSYTVTNGSCVSASVVPVTIETAPEAGTGTDVAICISDITAGQLLDLFTQLTGNDTGGTWNDDDATGALTGSNVDLNTLVVGTYNFTYTVAATANCGSDMETVAVTINDISAPTAPATQEFCDNATVADLVGTGNNIQWYDDMGLTILLAPGDALVDGEDYFATQTDAITNCESSLSAAVSVTIFLTPNTGVAVPLTVCSDLTMVDLFTALDGTQDAGGTWLDTDGTGALTGSTFDATAVADGTYNFEYTITASAPCVDASTIVTVIVQSPVSAGTDAAINLCSDNGTIDLFTLLGTADAGGTWSPTLNSTTGVFDPLVDMAGSYSYTVMNDCNTSTATVDVTIALAPNAGTDSSLTICVIDTPVDLLTQLGGTPDVNGTWSPLLSSGGNVFNPELDGTGIYTYTVTAISPCMTDAVATINIQVDDSLPPTVLNANLDFCATDDAMVMDLDAAVTGTMINWYDTIDGTTPLADSDLLVDGTTYFASQTNATGCESSVRVQVTVAVGDAPTPTITMDGNIFCINDNPTLLELTQNINEYDELSANVVWYDALDGTTPLSSSTVLVDGATYYAVLIDPVTGCESNIRLAIIADLTGCDIIEIPDGFSPNNDGTNDTFDADNLGFLYPDFKMEIYNRYGNLVYEGTNSTPRFNGISNQKALLNDVELPVGVYFYILNFNDGINKPQQGRLYLSR